MDNETVWNSNYSGKVKNAIETSFTKGVEPKHFIMNMNCVDHEMLNNHEKDVIRKKTQNNSKIEGAEELLNHLVKKKFWFRKILQALRIENSFPCVADQLEKIKGQVDESVVKRYSETGYPTEARMIEIQSQFQNMQNRMEEVHDRELQCEKHMKILEARIDNLEERTRGSTAPKEDVFELKDIKDAISKLRQKQEEETTSMKTTVQRIDDVSNQNKGQIDCLLQSDIDSKNFVIEMQVFRADNIKKQQTMEKTSSKVDEVETALKTVHKESKESAESTRTEIDMFKSEHEKKNKQLEKDLKKHVKEKVDGVENVLNEKTAESVKTKIDKLRKEQDKKIEQLAEDLKKHEKEKDKEVETALKKMKLAESAVSAETEMDTEQDKTTEQLTEDMKATFQFTQLEANTQPISHQTLPFDGASPDVTDGVESQFSMPSHKSTSLEAKTQCMSMQPLFSGRASLDGTDGTIPHNSKPTNLQFSLLKSNMQFMSLQTQPFDQASSDVTDGAIMQFPKTTPKGMIHQKSLGTPTQEYRITKKCLFEAEMSVQQHERYVREIKKMTTNHNIWKKEIGQFVIPTKGNYHYELDGTLTDSEEGQVSLGLCCGTKELFKFTSSKDGIYDKTFRKYCSHINEANDKLWIRTWQTGKISISFLVFKIYEIIEEYC